LIKIKKGVRWHYNLLLVEHLEKRNRRTFQNKTLQPSLVALLCKEDLEQYRLVTRANVGLQQV
jgi:hypothetical protein